MSAPPDDKHGFWRKARRLAGRLPFIKDAAAMYFAMLDTKTPLWAKTLIASAIAYLVSPMDAIPDVLVVVGYTDDAAVIAGTLALVGSTVTDEHRAQAEELFQ
jgi:uncharacterized membrane protein YkvA (DUF1232 family)